MKALFNIIILVLLLPCNDDAQSKRVQQNPSKTIAPTALNDSIAQILQRADLKESIYENRIRANFFKEALTRDFNFNLVFNYAKESLNNGDTDAAIKIIQNMLDSNPQHKEINANSKMAHDFLAICYLRKGEQLNCQDNHNDESCIIPIQGDGIYKIQNFTEQAIQKYLAILKAFPEDMQSRWLLNLAYMTLDQYPGKVPSQFLISIDNKHSKDAFQNMGTKVGADHYSLSGSVIADDFNNDDFIDIFTTS